MAEPLTVIAVLGSLGAAAAVALAWADSRLPRDRSALVDAIDELLPQTQCAQCGYPGCRPYAEAVAAGAAVNLCPPGGVATQQALARLLDRDPGATPAAPPPQVAVIDEARCIGCFLCVEACPVDAIVGAPQLMHTVLADRCTGCELCIEPCPMDCIAIEPVPQPVSARPLRILSRPRNREPDAPELACIRCGLCQDACPEALLPQELHWYCQTQSWTEAEQRGLDRCIECGLCNQVCPSNIDLLAGFTRGRQSLAAQAAAEAAADAARQQFQRHEARNAARAADWEARRRARLEDAGERPWLR
ncbi:MAG: RnfABCDGE type electron transport complex subunit B [Pseudomonadales bacterium]